MTGLFDATELAACRMSGRPGVMVCFTKNATEGMAFPRALCWTQLPLGGHVLPCASAVVRRCERISPGYTSPRRPACLQMSPCGRRSPGGSVRAGRQFFAIRYSFSRYWRCSGAR